MPRIARIVLPGHPHHIVQRGHNRQTVFAHEDDFARYLDDLQELKDVFDVKGVCVLPDDQPCALTASPFMR